MSDRNPELTVEEALPPPEEFARAHPSAVVPAESDPEWLDVLEYLLSERGFDFHGYKPASLSRRVRRRMETLGLKSFGAYQNYLQAHPAEFSTLFDTILINVTSFFRDHAAWDAVRTRALPEILAGKSPEEPIRAWCAGCASGEEAYTIAMILAEELSADEFQRRVKIYATDVDDDALNTARHASYSPRHVESVPPELLAKYFEHADGIYSFRKEFRRQVIFGRHDLINDAPISRVDLLTCRNTLMYLSAETQTRVLSRLHFALNEGGFLLLGRAETLMAHGHSFVAVDAKRRLSRKKIRRSLRDPSSMTAERLEQQDGAQRMRIHQAALEASPVAQLVIDAAGELAAANARARELLGVRKEDVGRQLRDLQLSYRPVELRSLIDRIQSERGPLIVKEIECRVGPGELRWLDLNIAPLLNDGGAVSGTILTFEDVTSHRQLQRELEQSRQELETAYGELQSTNEELETMNEELQSTNEELQTLNDELRRSSEDLNTSNAFLESVLSGLRNGVAVVDSEFRILAWNRQAAELWGLRQEEVGGKHLLNLDIGLPTEQIRPLFRTCLSGEGESQVVTLEAVNRRGKTIRCQITCTPLSNGSDGVRGAILLMEDSSDGKARGPGETVAEKNQQREVMEENRASAELFRQVSEHDREEAERIRKREASA